MINLRNSPLLWVALLLLFSFWIESSITLVLTRQLSIILWTLCAICGLLALIRYPPAHQYKSSIVIGILIFAAGLLRVNDFREYQYTGDLISESTYLEGILKVKQVLKNKNTSVTMKCQRITFFDAGEALTQKVNDKFLLILIKSDRPLHFFPGDMIRVHGWISAIEGPLNPNAFDARIHYNTLGIRHQMYCKGEDVKMEETAKSSIARMTARWQTSLSTIVRNNTSPQVAQLTNALVWGDRSDMDMEVRDAFADSGAMHVLSVSGMHVAIIYSMLFFILGAPGSGPFAHRLIRFICYAVAIILYMGLTGACPAVVRAGLMIILYLFGKAMGWNTQVWNLLGFAAFVMLWINPFVWQNIGFQLSFLAMAGILLFAKPIIRSISLKNKLLHIIWEIIALSIAAQVFILPVLLGKFHQFPLTFIISSIVAIPAAYLVMFGALLNILLSFIGIDVLWVALDWTGKTFINVMIWMAELNPGMYFSLPSLGGMFLMIMAVLFSVAIVFRWPFGKKIAYAAGVLTFISLGCHRTTQWSKSDLVIYHSYKGLIMDIAEGGRCISVHDCHLSPENIEFATRGYRCERDVIDVQNICLRQDFEKEKMSYHHSLLKLSGENILLWPCTDKEPDINSLHFVLINQCPDLHSFKEFLCGKNDITVILPVHLDRKIRKSIIKYLLENQVPFHDIDAVGYFKIEL